jgi:ABC-type antimicrobial peptide transport system permease subunit
LRGQTFEASHRLDLANKVIVSESLAKRYFVDEDPIGKHLVTMGEKPYEIIGVVSDTRYEVSKSPGPTMYFPLYGGGESGVTLAVRSGMEVTRLALPIQQTVQHLDPQLPVSDVMTMNELIGKSTIDANFDATLVLTFAGLSLVLASVGMYGVLSYLVTQRQSELGLRMALGALPGEVLRLTLADGLRPTALGLVFGLAAGAATTRLIRDLLYGVQPMDVSVFVGVAIVLVGISIAACLLPAWRASRLDPVKALRMD